MHHGDVLKGDPVPLSAAWIVVVSSFVARAMRAAGRFISASLVADFFDQIGSLGLL
jgi:hypothetical protein